MELFIWGPAFGLPSIDPECNAAIAYLSEISQVNGIDWKLIVSYDPAESPNHDFPALRDGPTWVAGFRNIVHYLSSHPRDPYSLDSHLSSEQRADNTAFQSFIQTNSQPLLDLSLYSTYVNYHATTRPAFTALLPWHANYVIPPARRAAAKARTSHLGLTSLNVGEETDGRLDHNKPMEQYDSAKKAAGLDTPAAARPSLLPLPQSAKMKQAIRDAQINDRFKLNNLASSLFDPLDDLLKSNAGRSGKRSLLSQDRITSLDCLAFGYLSLMLYSEVPQAWLKETIQNRYPRIRDYVINLRRTFIGERDINSAHVINGISTEEAKLPWQQPQSKTVTQNATTVAGNLLQLLSMPTWKSDIVNADSPSTTQNHMHSDTLSLSIPARLLTASITAASAFAAFAFYQVRYTPKSSRYYFFEPDTRPRARSTFADFGEAGMALAALGSQIQIDMQLQRDRERLGGAPIGEVEVEVDTTNR